VESHDLASWNEDGVRGRKLKLEHFLNKHYIDISHLSETLLNPVEAFQIANRQTYSGERYSHPGPPWYSPLLSARSGHHPLGGHLRSSHIGR
jgi:hypothetical protein